MKDMVDIFTLSDDETKNEDPQRQQFGDIIQLLVGAKRYSTWSNADIVGRVFSKLVRWLFPISMATFLIGSIAEIAIPSQTRYRESFAAKVIFLNDCLSLVTGVIVMVSGMIFLFRLKRRPLGIIENDVKHMRQAFELYRSQVASLTQYPLDILQEVKRFYKRKPLAVRGLYSVLSGKWFVGWASIAWPLALFKGLSDTHMLTTPDKGLANLVWMFVVFLAWMSVIIWWNGKREDYQCALLEDAIEVLSGEKKKES